MEYHIKLHKGLMSCWWIEITDNIQFRKSHNIYDKEPDWFSKLWLEFYNLDERIKNEEYEFQYF